MSKMKFFQELINSLFDKPIKSNSFNIFQDKSKSITTKDYIENVASAKGEVSALGYAELLMKHCEELNDKELLNFFKLIRDNFEITSDQLSNAIEKYQREKNSENLVQLMKVAEPKRREIFRRCNGISRGTIRLVNLRKRLLGIISKHPELKAVDYDLVYLFKNWFNRGFLILRPINWETPAHILEKIIAYEAVHEINSWDELRSRLAPKDRRCFAFFHPAMQDEPIIFVEVALMKEVPSKIQDVLQEKRNVFEPEETTVAVFYSISNCQKGLAGISFGNFLIKQVANDLNLEFKNLKKFVTLSPVPGLRKWISDKHPKFAKSLEKLKRAEQFLKVHDNMMEYVGKYFLSTERTDKMPNDPVARFHLGNGAILEKINLNADLSKKGILQSKGMMVNYLYNLELLEKNHELFFKTKIVQQSDEIKSLKKKLQIHT